MRNEYPRPGMERDRWLSLNGTWDFQFSDEKNKRKIQVPFVYQCKLSGIGETRICEKVVYSKNFTVPEDWRKDQILLHFGAVDYRCRVYINGSFVGSHEGGHTPFTFDITPFLTWDFENIVVEVEDPLKDETIPRGKQFWEEKPRSIWYTQSTGIWQTVWLEPVNRSHIEWIRFIPDIDRGTVDVIYRVSDSCPLPVVTKWVISLKGRMICEHVVTVYERESRFSADIFGNHIFNGSFHGDGLCWTPENPVLFDVEVFLTEGGEVTDRLKTYFGMRKIHIENNRVYLNNRPYYQKLILDQGYWPDGLLTAPNDQAYADDIMKAKEMGFNGCRKHEKAEEPRFLYWADRLGFLVWGGMASFISYSFDACVRFMTEWQDIIRRDFNHPCIVVWNVLNESWGVPQIYNDRMQQHFSQTMYHMAHSLDPTRLVISNDGWEMTETDICAIHSYQHGDSTQIKKQNVFRDSLRTWEGLNRGDILHRLPYVKGFGYNGEPVILTEFGGISYNARGSAWGYTDAESEEDFLKEYERLIDAIYDSDVLCGFCYTQLTDVQQEVNGLLTEQRTYKFDPKAIREINNKYHK